MFDKILSALGVYFNRIKNCEGEFMREFVKISDNTSKLTGKEIFIAAIKLQDPNTDF